MKTSKIEQTNFKALKFKNGTYSNVRSWGGDIFRLEQMAKNYDIVFKMQGISNGYLANVGSVMKIVVKPLKENMNFFEKYIICPKEDSLYPPDPFVGRVHHPSICSVVKVLIDSLKDRGY